MMTEDKARAARRAAARAADRYIAPDGSSPREDRAQRMDKAAKKVERIERAIRIVRAVIPAKQSVARSEFESLVAILATDYGVDP